MITSLPPPFLFLFSFMLYLLLHHQEKHTGKRCDIQNSHLERVDYRAVFEKRYTRTERNPDMHPSNFYFYALMVPHSRNLHGTAGHEYIQ